MLVCGNCRVQGGARESQKSYASWIVGASELIQIHKDIKFVRTVPGNLTAILRWVCPENSNLLHGPKLQLTSV